MNSNDLMKAFASTSRGLEQLLSKELTILGAKDIVITNAGAKFSADFTTIMKINLHSRIASRVMLEIARAEYLNETDIYNLAYQINWQTWFDVEKSIKLYTTAIHCPLKSLDFITLKVKDAICDKFSAKVGTRPNVDKTNSDIRIYNFLTKDTITIYIDTSGEGLFKRGYRQNKLEAPLKENLASGLVQLSGWNSTVTLLDPMCGSGTIIIEALGLALNIAPGLNRRFAFEHINNFATSVWQSLKQQAIAQIHLETSVNIYANDIDFRATHTVKENLNLFLKQLGDLLPNQTTQIKQIFNQIKFSTQDILDLNAPDSSGIFITNPPYGVRLEDQEHLEGLYPLISAHLKNNFANWNCYFLTNDLQMPKLMRLKPSKKTPVFNGALECRFFEFKMVQGSNR